MHHRAPAVLRRCLPVLAFSFALPLAAQTVGLPFQADLFTTPCHDPVAAYDETHGIWLVVYRVETSATTAEIRGQFVQANGIPLYVPVVIEATADNTVRPSVCNVNQTDRFVVGYRRHLTGLPPIIADTNWYVRSVEPGSIPTVSNRELVPSSAATGAITELVLGGDSRQVIGTFANYALVVVRRDAPSGGSNSIAFGKVDTTNTDPVLAGLGTLTTPTTACGDVAVSPLHTNHWLVTWCQSSNALLPFTSVRAQFVDQVGVSCGPLTQLQSGTTAVSRPSVAVRSAEDFAVAWEHGTDIRVRTLNFSGSCISGVMTLGATVAPVSLGLNSEPSITWAQQKYVLAWRRTAIGSPSAVLAKGLDPQSCTACSQEWVLEYDADAQGEPAVCSRESGGDSSSDETVVVWSDGDIRGRRFEATSNDVVVNMGGGCANTGFANVATNDGECVIGNSNFKLVLATPTLPALVLTIGFSAVSVPCGACTIVPSPDILLPAVTPTTLAIPCDPMLVGADLYTQWLLLKPSTCPLLPDFSFTNALKFTIGE